MENQLRDFIKGGNLGTFTAVIGESTWEFERKFSTEYGCVVSSIVEKVRGVDHNAEFDTTDEECLSVLDRRVDEYAVKA